MSKVYMRTNTLNSNCGVSVFHDFAEYPDYWNTDPPKLYHAKLAVAGFINNDICKKAYEKLASKFNLVYQSPPRKSGYSGKQYFLVVYDGKKPKPAKIKKAKPATVHYNQIPQDVVVNN